MIPRSFLSITAQCCSSPYKKHISDEELKDILTRKKELTKDSEWFFHIALLFSEVPHKYLAGTMRELGVTLQDVKYIWNSLPKAFQGSYFLEFEKYYLTEQGSSSIKKG